MQAESAALPETPEQADYLIAVADDLVRSFTRSHVTAERAEAIRLAFKDVLLVSITVPALSGQALTIGNFAAEGDTDMTMVPMADSAAGHTLQHKWAISTSMLVGYKDVPVSPSITSLVSTPLFDNGNSTPAATLPQPESPCYYPMSRRSFSAPNLDETLDQNYSSYDLSSWGWPSRQSHDWNEAESTHESSLDEPEADMLYWGARSEPRVVGALIMGIKGDRWPRRRDVDELAELLGPLLAPLVGKAVNLASAAFVARTLARPAIPVSKFAEAGCQPSMSSAATCRKDEGYRGASAFQHGSEDDSLPLRRSATASWVLSEGEREIVTSLISCPIMTQPRSLSGLPEDLCLTSSPPYASPLMESMVCAASLVSRTCSSSTSQSNPSIGFTFTPSIPLIGKKPENLLMDADATNNTLGVSMQGSTSPSAHSTTFLPCKTADSAPAVKFDDAVLSACDNPFDSASSSKYFSE